MDYPIYNLAFDFGASSGRLMISKFDGEKIELEEIHRFANEPVKLGDCLYWDFPRLFHELKTGLKKAAAKKVTISGIGIDTWGVDYGLLDKNEQLISNPVHYRDMRTEGIPEEVEKTMGSKEIYNTTGIQFMNFNTIYQLYADRKYRNHLLREAKTLLFMPDLFSFFLTGMQFNEYTIASTSQLLDVHTKQWAEVMLEKLNIPHKILQPIIMPGQIGGYLKPDIQQEVGLAKIPVIAVGSHDTASAVAGTPLLNDKSAYLSCGTWSLMGLERTEPLVNGKSLEYSFTNEGGVEGTIRFLKNINGLWIIQQLRKCWSETVAPITFPEISKAASEVQNSAFVINPDDERFMAPINMITAIQEYCREKGQGTPESIGEIARAVYNGLASQYKHTIETLEEIAEHSIEVLHMVGGGIQDEYLCRITAEATGKRVLAGPVEASVLGNVIMQLIAVGAVENLEQGREVVKNSFAMKEYRA